MVYPRIINRYGSDFLNGSGCGHVRCKQPPVSCGNSVWAILVANANNRNPVYLRNGRMALGCYTMLFYVKLCYTLLYYVILAHFDSTHKKTTWVAMFFNDQSVIPSLFFAMNTTAWTPRFLEVKIEDQPMVQKILGVPSGYVKIAIENGPVEIVDLPS